MFVHAGPRATLFVVQLAMCTAAAEQSWRQRTCACVFASVSA
jgi:hypothetical protein